MSTQRKLRAAKREATENPINFTCGECFRVHKFDKENPYICIDKIKEE